MLLTVSTAIVSQRIPTLLYPSLSTTIQICFNHTVLKVARLLGDCHAMTNTVIMSSYIGATMSTPMYHDADSHPNAARSSYTGHELLALRIPHWDETARYLRPVAQPTGKVETMDVGDVDSRKWIPSVENVTKAHSEIIDKDVYGAQFLRMGIVTKKALPLLLQRCKVTEFAENLRDLRQWLIKHQNAENTSFLEWFERLLEHEPDIMNHTFMQQYINIRLHISESFCLKEEDYLNDEVVRVVFRLLEHHYNEGFVFIPPLGLANWITHLDPCPQEHLKVTNLETGILNIRTTIASIFTTMRPLA